MNPDESTQPVEVMESELQTILARLTAEAESAKNLAVEIKTLDEDADKLEQHITASQKDITVFMEEQSKELDTMLAEGQKEAEADKTAE